MADDGEIVINTKIDESGFNKGIQNLAQKIKEAGNAIESAAEKSGQQTSAAVKKASDEAAKAVQKAADASAKSADYAAKNTKQLEDSLKALEVEASAKGEAVSAQARYNVYLKSYIDLLAKSNGTVQKGMPIERQRIKQLKEAEKALKEEAEAAEKSGKASKSLTTVFNENGGAAAGFAGKMKNLAAAGGPVAAGITAAIAAAKAFIGILKEGTEAYKVQEKAEGALQAAAANNPYLSSESVQRLKDYASELQGVTNFGDEGTIDVMAQLAASGRSEAEIMKLIGAASDYAAAKHISLEAAVGNLNKSYGGLAGELGELFPEVKALSEEQLKNGEAVDIIAKKYQGFAKNAADSSIQAKNAFGDFMESIGRIAKPAFDGLAKLATAVWTKAGEALNKFSDKLEQRSLEWKHGGIHKAVDEGVKAINTKSVDVKTWKETSGEKAQTTEYLEWLKKELELRKDLNSEETQALILIKSELRQRKAIIAEEKKQADAEKEKQGKTKKTADEYIAENEKRLQENLKLLEIEAKAKGVAVKEQDQFNVYMNSYVDLLTKTEGLITEGLPIEQKRIAQVKEAGKAVKEAADAEEKRAAAIKYAQEAAKAIESAKLDLTPAEDLHKALEELDKIKQKIQEVSEEEVKAAQKGHVIQLSKAELLEGLEKAKEAAFSERYKKFFQEEASRYEKLKTKAQELADFKEELRQAEIDGELDKQRQLEEIDKQIAETKAAQAAEALSVIKKYVDQAAQIVKDAGDLALQYIQAQTKKELAEEEIRYLKGEESEEEYEENKKKIKHDAAKEEYKIKLWQWHASLLQATASIAEGVARSLAQGGALGAISAALTAIAGGVQIATLVANKPRPPSFSGGGFVGGMHGASMGADDTVANVRRGELYVNAAQQRNLWEHLNGKGAGGKGTNIVVNNNASNIVNAEPRISQDKIALMIDARVNESLKDGRYSNSLKQAENGMSGDYYGI